MGADYLVKDRLETYYFRIAVAKKLRTLSQKLPKEIRKTTGTKSKKEAEKIAQFYAFKADLVFKKILAVKQYNNEDELVTYFRDCIQQELSLNTEAEMPAIANIQSNFQTNSVNTLTRGLKLSKLVEIYIKENELKNNWQRDKSRYEAIACLNLFQRIVGDKYLSEINHEVILDYQDSLRKLPANINKYREYDGKSISQIIAKSNKKVMAILTLNKNLRRVMSLFNFAYEKEYVSKNYAKNLLIKQSSSQAAKREGFTDSDIKKLFSTEIHSAESKKKSKYNYQYWIPLLGLYSGGRLDELCQLHTDDVIEVEGIWCISINRNTKNKKLKNASSERVVPLHSKLIEIGFLKFVEYQRSKKQERLFTELKLARDGYGGIVSKWFSGFKTKAGITSKTKVFHSFRHTVADRLKQKSIVREKIGSILGHKDDNITTGLYGKAYHISVLKEVIEELDYDAGSIRKFC